MSEYVEIMKKLKDYPNYLPNEHENRIVRMINQLAENDIELKLIVDNIRNAQSSTEIDQLLNNNVNKQINTEQNEKGKQKVYSLNKDYKKAGFIDVLVLAFITETFACSISLLMILLCIK